jgi:hypothetical protein
MVTQFMQDDRNMRRAAGAGSVVEAIAAVAAAVLCIIGLATGASLLLVAIVTIVLGGALLIDGGGIAARHRYLRSMTEEAHDAVHGRKLEELGQTSAESVAGIAGIVLGVLSLIGLAPHFLLPIALIVYGGGMLLGTSTPAHGRVAGGGHALLGVSAVVLGILALVGVVPGMLILIGFLVVSLALLFSGTAMGARLLAPHHAH